MLFRHIIQICVFCKLCGRDCPCVTRALYLYCICFLSHPSYFHKGGKTSRHEESDGPLYMHTGTIKVIISNQSITTGTSKLITQTTTGYKPSSCLSKLSQSSGCPLPRVRSDLWIAYWALGWRGLDLTPNLGKS